MIHAALDVDATLLERRDRYVGWRSSLQAKG
jgi:hypothetical protein